MYRLKIKNIIIAIILFIILMILFIVMLYNLNLAKVSKDDTLKEITIKDGMPVSNIISLLKKENLIKDELVTKIYVKLNKTSIQAGVYELSENMGTKEILSILSTGKITTKYNINLTFKEGKNIRDYAKVIASNTDNTEEDVFNLLNDKEYIDSLIDKYWFLTSDIKNKEIYYPLEGYLFPETYTFKDKSVTVKEIFSVMLNQTNIVLSKYKDDIESKHLNIHEFMSLASIVELEGLYKEDRKEIAGVIYNRLKSGWSLGCDATSYYAAKADMGTQEALYEWLIMDSPYNTRHPNMAGKLPVGPIGNPGIESIEASINPKDTDNYFWVADCKTGKSVFTKTETEHIQAINRIKQSGCRF